MGFGDAEYGRFLKKAPQRLSLCNIKKTGKKLMLSACLFKYLTLLVKVPKRVDWRVKNLILVKKYHFLFDYIMSKVFAELSTESDRSSFPVFPVYYFSIS
jgi:hypothetical protein